MEVGSGKESPQIIKVTKIYVFPLSSGKKSEFVILIFKTVVLGQTTIIRE